MLQCSRSISKINLQFPVAFVDYTGNREARKEASYPANRANRHVYSDRPRYLRKPLIKGSKDRRTRIKPLPPNCSRDYRFVLPSRKKRRPTTFDCEIPAALAESWPLGNRRLIKYYVDTDLTTRFVNFHYLEFVHLPRYSNWEKYLNSICHRKILCICISCMLCKTFWKFINIVMSISVFVNVMDNDRLNSFMLSTKYILALNIKNQ